MHENPPCARFILQVLHHRKTKQGTQPQGFFGILVFILIGAIVVDFFKDHFG